MKNTQCLENCSQGSLTKQERHLQGNEIFTASKGMQALLKRLGRPTAHGRKGGKHEWIIYYLGRTETRRVRKPAWVTWVPEGMWVLKTQPREGVKLLGPGPLQNLEEAWNVSHSEHNWGIEVVGGKRGAVSNQGGVWNQLKPLWNWRSELVLEWQLLLQVSPKVSWAGWEHWDYRSAENESGALFKIVQSNEWFCNTWGWEAARELLN